MDYAVPTNPADDARALGVVYNAAKPIGGIRYVDQRERSVIIDKLSKKVQVRVAEEAEKAVTPITAQVVETPAAEIVAPNQTQEIAVNVPEAKLNIQRYDADHPKPAEPTLEEKISTELTASQDEKAVTETVTAITELLQSNTNIAQEVAKAEPFDARKEALLAYQESMQELGVKVNHKALRRGIYYSKPGAYVVEVNGLPTDFSSEGINKITLDPEDRIWLMKAQRYFLEARDDANRKIGSAAAYTTPEILEALWATAVQVGVDPKRFLVQVYNESRFNPHARGDAGERGIGQFMRNTAKMLELDWSKMSGGEETFAYQARCAAEFVKSVGESRYNGGNPEYVRMISSRLSAISQTRVTDYTCSSEACV